MLDIVIISWYYKSVERTEKTTKETTEMAKQQVKEISKKELRTVKILVRYFIKATKNVVLYVENDKGVRYYVSLKRDGNHSCSCPAHKSSCYHIKVCKGIENARIEARLAAKAVKVVELPAPVEAPKEVPDIMNAPLTTNR